jgi:hypothetical protein
MLLCGGLRELISHGSELLPLCTMNCTLCNYDCFHQLVFDSVTAVNQYILVNVYDNWFGWIYSA